ncbi:endonuclease-reverse transcriptase [Trichonephila clavipes]|uniref:Endonuclease-reverse transcriptase n=1 Tax=Trichonephila clavipes TaxID=2585209 RepID=A0A8X6SXC3_TRICX|nr:endonuclease-reverse transcriptase [Trichonephila clavipes]
MRTIPELPLTQFPDHDNLEDIGHRQIPLYMTSLKWLYKEPQVTQVIRSNRLRWLGHIWRSHENNQTRAYTFKNPMGSRTRGRPPTRWIDDVENDLKTLNIKNWQRVAARVARCVREENRTTFQFFYYLINIAENDKEAYNLLLCIFGI